MAEGALCFLFTTKTYHELRRTSSSNHDDNVIAAHSPVFLTLYEVL